MIALASTIYFRAKWGSEFSKSATTDGVFHAPDGDVTHKFMHKTMESTYYAADNFAAVGKYLEGSGTMWFLLPDEGRDAGGTALRRQRGRFLSLAGERREQVYDHRSLCAEI